MPTGTRFESASASRAALRLPRRGGLSVRTWVCCGDPQHLQRCPPLDIAVRNIQRLVQGFEFRVEMLVGLVLPVGARGVAEDHAAAEGADGVDATEFSDLERAAGAVPG